MVKENIIQKTGKRKTSVARVTIKSGSGKIYINNQLLEIYFPNKILQLKVMEPFLLSNLLNKFDVKVNVFGGGVNSQADAIRQAIARSLVEITGKEELKIMFQNYDKTLIISDTRFKEMKKPNNSHARAKRQKSYR